MSEHTPGPWAVRRITLHEAGEGIEVYSTITGETIADNQTYYPQALEEKNAHLIAAAPDLLAALKTIRTWLIAPALDQATLEEMYTLTKTAINTATRGANA